jgi:hypothetical protein
LWLQKRCVGGDSSIKGDIVKSRKSENHYDELVPLREQLEQQAEQLRQKDEQRESVLIECRRLEEENVGLRQRIKPIFFSKRQQSK